MFEFFNKVDALPSYRTEAAVQELLIDLGVIGRGEIIMPEDFEATMQRAKILIKEDPSLTEEAAISLGYADRMSFIMHSMSGVIEKMDQDTLLNMIKETGHREVTVEDINLLIKFIKDRPDAVLSESIVEWSKARAEAQGNIEDVNVLVDGNENVLTVGDQSKIRKTAEGERDFQ